MKGLFPKAWAVKIELVPAHIGEIGLCEMVTEGSELTVTVTGHDVAVAELLPAIDWSVTNTL